MKKQLLLLVSSLFIFASYSYSQCIPDFSQTTPGVYPDTIVNLDTATEAQAYSDTLQFRVHSTVPPATVDSVKILSLTGMPAGLTYSTNPSGNVFLGGNNGCVLVDGTPTTAGTYPLSIMLRFYGNISGFPVQIDTPLTGYKIIVLPASGIPKVNNASFSVNQNIPNPFEVATEISFNVPIAGKVDFKVVDLLGKELINKKIDAVSGINKTYVSSRYLKSGIYFYSFTFKSKTITRKMIVASRP
jgi:hypothetical protein